MPDGEYSVQAPRVVFTGGELVESALPNDQELTLNAYSVEVDGGDATIEVKLSERATTPEE